MNTDAYLTFTLSAATLAKLAELRRLQIERWRAAYFKRIGEMPPESIPELDRTWVAVTVGCPNREPLSLALRISLLAAWAATFKGLDNPAIEAKLTPGNVLTLRRGSSTLCTYGAELQHTPEGLPYIPGAYGRPLLVFPDPAAPLTVGPDGMATLPAQLEGDASTDASAELKALRAEATATRKALASAKAIAKAKRNEAAALEKLQLAQTEAAEAQALIDGQTLAGAVKYARRVLAARRLWCKTEANPEFAPAWLPLTYAEPAGQAWDSESADWEDTPAREVPVMPEYRELLAVYQTAGEARAAYKPRVRWPSYFSAKDKADNPDMGVPVYGPKHEELTAQLSKARLSLISYLRDRFAEFAGATLGLTFAADNPHALTSEWLSDTLRPYSRARLLLKAWHASVRHERQGAYELARAARVRLEGGSTEEGD